MATPTSVPSPTPDLAQQALTKIREGEFLDAVALSYLPDFETQSVESRHRVAKALLTTVMTRTKKGRGKVEPVDIVLARASVRIADNVDAQEFLAFLLLKPRLPMLQNAQLSRPQLIAVKGELDELLEVVPRSSMALYSRSVVADLENDHDLRVALLERAVRTSSKPHIVAALQRARAEKNVEGKFRGAKDSRFEARFEGFAQESIAWAAIRTLDKAYFRVNQRLQLHPKQKFTVVIYTGGQYMRALGLPDWSDGAFDGKIRIRGGDVKKGSKRLENLLFHEYTHAALYTVSPRGIPAWFNEGLAQAFEPDTSQTEKRSKRLVSLASRNNLLHPYKRLSDVSFTQMSGANASLAYAQAFSLVKYMRRLQGDRGVAKLLRKIRDGATFESAFKIAYFSTPEAFFEKWRRTQPR